MLVYPPKDALNLGECSTRRIKLRQRGRALRGGREAALRERPRRSGQRRGAGVRTSFAEENVEENVIESHISKLRKKLKMRLGYDPVSSKRYLGYGIGVD